MAVAGTPDLLESVVDTVPVADLAEGVAPEAISEDLLDDDPVGEEILPPVHLEDKVLGRSLLPYVTLFLSLNE
jgi:hypothetical protein